VTRIVCASSENTRQSKWTFETSSMKVFNIMPCFPFPCCTHVIAFIILESLQLWKLSQILRYGSWEWIAAKIQQVPQRV
jgi:hypothetical protein